jgi:hypothetical protein
MTGIDEKGWTAIWRLLRMLETKMYRGSFLQWREIFLPQLAVRTCYVGPWLKTNMGMRV